MESTDAVSGSSSSVSVQYVDSTLKDKEKVGASNDTAHESKPLKDRFSQYEFILVFDHSSTLMHRVSSFLSEHAPGKDDAAKDADSLVASALARSSSNETKPKKAKKHLSNAEKQGRLISHMQQAGITVTKVYLLFSFIESHIDCHFIFT
jgi:hypothetical protein